MGRRRAMADQEWKQVIAGEWGTPDRGGEEAVVAAASGRARHRALHRTTTPGIGLAVRYLDADALAESRSRPWNGRTGPTANAPTVRTTAARPPRPNRSTTVTNGGSPKLTVSVIQRLRGSHECVRS
ncbi:hypothetical protein GCM10010102_28990 [Promicromonospora citrea]|uniref:Uncharacterized protein n=1 Tax=Promicromonospora citrea TaxID=43677 RepID=A0A8H9GJ93_9MICO|nr:hypothetical protein GCM10010102_28990 [Promicromonospora citrea]